MNLSKTEMIGLGIALGGAIGTVLGAALHQYGAWLPIGIGVGVAVASGIAERQARCGAGPREQTKSQMRARS